MPHTVLVYEVLTKLIPQTDEDTL